LDFVQKNYLPSLALNSEILHPQRPFFAHKSWRKRHALSNGKQVKTTHDNFKFWVKLHPKYDRFCACALELHQRG